MTARAPMLFLLSIASGWACLDSAGPAPHPTSTDDSDGDGVGEEICDGTDDLRLAVFNRSTGHAGEAQTELTRIGWWFLYVDGKCNYWAKTADNFDETHTGVLTKAQADDVANAFSYGKWKDVTGVWEKAGAQDADFRVVHDTNTGFACYAGCPWAPEIVIQAHERSYEVVEHLYELGKPEPVPMRVAIEAKVVTDSASGKNLGDFAFEWPLADGPDVVSPWVFGGEVLEGGFVVTDEQELKLLREARLDKQGHGFPSQVILGPWEDYWLKIHMRDVLPMESANGRIPEPELLPRP